MTTVNSSTRSNAKYFIDEINMIGSHAHTALTQLEVFFKVIANSLENEDSKISTQSLKYLAEAGQYLAGDQANIIDSIREGVVDDYRRGSR